MIIFEKISYQNFLSTGNVANEIFLSKSPATLITGANGHGKSTLLDAICFVLYGKPYRNVNKGQLVNSINQKQCLVQVTFKVNGHTYSVNRGIKPNIFEIYCDGVMINQDASQKDYQVVLEQQILKINFKTFTQVIILGSSTFVPFMKLNAQGRRDVIEDILDIKVFSVMNALLKTHNIDIKQQITNVDQQISQKNNDIKTQTQLINTIEQSKQNVVDSIQNRIDSNNQQINLSRDLIDQTNNEITTLKATILDNRQIKDHLTTANKMKTKLSSNIDMCEKNINFFNQNITCPTCAQSIDDNYKNNVVKEIQTTIATHMTKVGHIDNVVDKLQIKIKHANDVENTIRDLKIDVTTLTNKINILEQQNQELMQELSCTKVNNNIDHHRVNVNIIMEDVQELNNQKSNITAINHLHEMATGLLKDTGIKTAIIREYLPIINKLINRYLDAMNLFVKFEINQSFEETIMSRGRDAFTYESFSEGEKQKINLAIMLMWRQIAKLKNSINTNLLIMDEVFDSSLDTNGIELVSAIMGEVLTDLNVFVISHRENISTFNFNKILFINKVGDFSILSAIKD